MQLQLTELLTRYGPAALIWFDGLHHQEKYGGIRFLNLIHQLQPATLVNDRIGLRGDYQTPEQFIPQGIPTKDVSFNAVDTSIQEKLKPVVPKPEDFQLWETCMTINNTWAYNMHDRESYRRVGGPRNWGRKRWYPPCRGYQSGHEQGGLAPCAATGFRVLRWGGRIRVVRG